MRLIEFKRICLQNFLSFGENETIVEFRPGVNLITGQNLDKHNTKNGSGKSALCCDSIHFALFGTTLREIPKDFIPNSLTNKKCKVELDFDITTNETNSYKIIRTLNPSTCKLYMNDKDITRSTLIQTNKYIQELIRTSPTVFQNSVLMSVNTTKPFMSFSKIEKRKFIESVLGLEVFAQMILEARNEHAKLREEFEVSFAEHNRIKSELTFVQKQCETHLINLQNQQKELETKEESLVKEIADTRQQLQELETKIQAFGDLRVKESEIKDLLKKTKEKASNFKQELWVLERHIEDLQKKISVLENHKDRCPECLRPFDKNSEHVHTIEKRLSAATKELGETNDKKVNTTKKLEELVETENKLEATHQKLNEKICQYNEISSDLSSKRTSLAYLIKALEEVKSAKEKLKVHDSNKELFERKDQLLKLDAELQKKVTTLNDNLNLIEAIRFIISEDGIKTFLVKRIIQVFNNRIMHYLRSLDANCICRFDESFNEQTFDLNNQEKSYFNFSAGERKRIDLACLFAFADIRRMQGDVYFNTFFYDELLDSSLDDKGIELTINILEARYKELNESCYIITHRDVDIEEKINSRLIVEKRNGISYLLTQ